MESELQNKQNSTSSKIVIAIIVAGVLICCLVSICLFGTGMLVWSNSSSTISQPINHKPDAFVEISVGKDGCGVYRGKVQGSSEISSLTWVITDMDGFSVLERNAENEYQYRYFENGSFKVYIKAWYNGTYHQISDEVIINCK